MKRTLPVISAVVLATTLVVGCGGSISSASNNPATLTNSGSNGTGSTTVGRNASNQTGSSNNVSVAGGTANVTPNPNSVNSTGTPTSSSTAVMAFVRQSMHLAKEGQVVGVQYAVQQNLDAVETAWGHSDSQSSAGAGIYVTYGSRATAFGINKGGQIFDIRSYSSQVHSITLRDIETVLGKPGEIRYTSDSVIYMYPAGPNNQLLWVFSKTNKGKTKATVDHVSVFWPQGTVNIMAATQPAPSIVIDNAPGTVGSLFTFSIVNPPTGYRLVELEWLPDAGTPVIDTFSSALANGRTGSNLPGFSISGDGQTLSFDYPAAMAEEHGIVRVIYQAASGSAMIGNSPPTTLK